MRILVLALVLVNALFFAWQYWIAGTREVATVDPYRGVPVLELAPSAPVVPVADPEPVAVARASEPAPGLCAELGPFKDRAAAEEGIQRLGLADGGASLDDRLRERTVFWVYLEPFPSRQAANSALKQMEAAGISDAFVVNDSQYRNAVSLGLYSTDERAQRRLGQVREAGQRPRVQEQDRSTTAVWASLVLADAAALEAVGVKLGADAAVSIREVPCGRDGQDDGADEQP